jgi:pimeloyl-ACP methyl ester carboxylesterase
LPILFLLRAFFTVLSVAILGAAAALLYAWYDGEWIAGLDGVLRHHRDAWQLWAGGALLAWSLLGRWPMLWLLAARDTEPMRPRRDNGRTIQSTTGASLYVEDHGKPQSQPIILTHGWSMDSTIWYYARRDLSDRFRVLVWDLPGLGRSKRSGPRVCLSAFAEDLKSVIAQTGEMRPLLVGHSIGGMIIETLARDDPEFFRKHVAGVALFNTTYTNPLRTMILPRLMQTLRKPLIVPMMYLQIALSPLVWLLQWQSYLSGSQHLSVRFGFGRHVTRSQLDHTALLMTRNSPAVVARGDLAMIRWDGSDGVAKLAVPTLVLGGDLDIVTKLEAGEEIAEAAPDARLEVVSGANHMGPVERAEFYHRALVGFADARIREAPTLQPGARSVRDSRADPFIQKTS